MGQWKQDNYVTELRWGTASKLFRLDLVWHKHTVSLPLSPRSLHFSLSYPFSTHTVASPSRPLRGGARVKGQICDLALLGSPVGLSWQKIRTCLTAAAPPTFWIQPPCTELECVGCLSYTCYISPVCNSSTMNPDIVHVWVSSHNMVKLGYTAFEMPSL